MVDFSNEILKAISNYKLILRKTLTVTECTSKMRELGLKRQYVRKTDEVGLYELGLKIVAELKKQTEGYTDVSKRSNNFYRGTYEFLQHLEQLYAEHCIEDGRVVNVWQKASTALVNAIQLITMSAGKLSEKNVKQIIKYGNIIINYGTKEQKEMFINAVNEHQQYIIREFPKQMFSDLNKLITSKAAASEAQHLS